MADRSDATPAPGPRAGTGQALRAGVPAGAGIEEVGGGPLADSLPRSARGPAGSRRCERRRGTAHTWTAGRHRAGAAGRCAGGGWHRGDRRGTARGLTASLGLRVGWEPAPQGEGKKGGRWSAHGLSPGEFQVGRGQLARGHSAGSGRQQLGATAWRRLAPVGPVGLAAGERVGADSRTEGGQGGQKVSGA